MELVKGKEAAVSETKEMLGNGNISKSECKARRQLAKPDFRR